MIDNLSKYSPVVLRVAMSLVFLWFGSQQLMHAEKWTSFVPAFVTLLPAVKLVILNGWLEVVLGVFLLVGFHVRIVSFILAVHLFGIAGTMGFSAIGIRDFGLSLATLSVFLAGADFLCIDKKLG